MSGLINALIFILTFLFEAYIFILMLRLCLQKLGAHFFNPITQFVYKMTEPLIRPLRRFIPGFNGIDFAIVMLMLVLEVIKLYLIIGLKFKAFPGIVGVLIVAVGELGNILINVFFYATIIAVVISWIPSLARNPLAEIVNLLAEPLFRPARRMVPMIGGFDLSPILVIIALKVIAIILFYPLIKFGLKVAFG